MQDTQNPQISQKQDGSNIYVIMVTMSHSSYHPNGFVATDVFEKMVFDYILLVIIKQRVLN